MGQVKSANLKFSDLNLLECGQEFCVPSKRVEPFAKKEVYTIHFIQGGKGFVRVNETTKMLQTGDLFVMYPDQVMAYYPDNKKPWSYNWVILTGANIDTIIAESGISPANPFASYGNSSEIGRLFSKIYMLYKQEPYTHIECIGLMYTIFAKMIQRHNADAIDRQSKFDEYMKDAMTFIHNNYAFSITVSDMANNACISPKYLWNIFVKELGISPKQYLTKVRMEKAYELMSGSKLLVRELASWIGYIDQLHFSRDFKKYYGISPRQMIKKLSEMRK